MVYSSKLRGELKLTDLQKAQVEIEVDKYEDFTDWQEENYVDSVYRSI